MANISAIDLALAVGLVLLGWLLAVYFKSKYKVPKREFFAFSFFVAGLAIMLIWAYHMLRTVRYLFP